MIDIAVGSGVNLFDTADEYSAGRAEEILGAALRGRRDAALISTKVRTPTGTGPNCAGSSRHHVIRAVEASLRRLGTDYVDLLSLHAWDGETPLEETLSVLDNLISTGKVRYIGACNFSGWHLSAAVAVSERLRYQRLVSHQMHYSLLTRDAENELLPAAIFHRVGVLVWSPLAGGWLTGKYRRDVSPRPPARQLGDWDEPPLTDHERLHRIVDALANIARERGVSAASIALAWLLGRPGVTSLILGARTERQLSGNLAAANLRLSDAETEALDAISLEPPPYPLWHQAKLAADRLSPADRVALGPYLSGPDTWARGRQTSTTGNPA